MSEIPAIYWMIIIGVLTASVVTLILYLALSAKELANTLATVNKTMEEANKVVISAQKIVSDAETKINGILYTIDQLNKIIQSPLSLLEGFFSRFNKSK